MSSNYLSDRSQLVQIGAHRSSIKPIRWGIPQGSVLGPTLHSIYTNELSDSIKDSANCTDNSHNNNEKLFGENCENCGLIMNYADDTTYGTRNRTRNENSQQIVANMEKLSNFITSNEMIINQDKSQLFECMTRPKRCRMDNNSPSIMTTNIN